MLYKETRIFYSTLVWPGKSKKEEETMHTPKDAIEIFPFCPHCGNTGAFNSSEGL